MASVVLAACTVCNTLCAFWASPNCKGLGEPCDGGWSGLYDGVFGLYDGLVGLYWGLVGLYWGLVGTFIYKSCGVSKSSHSTCCFSCYTFY